jgi:hypothetical protein
MFQPFQPGADERPANTLSLPRGGDSKRSQQRNLVVASVNRTWREKNVPRQNRAYDPDEREGDGCFLRQRSHQWQEIFVRECSPTDRLDRRPLTRHTFADFNFFHHASSKTARSSGTPWGSS